MSFSSEFLKPPLVQPESPTTSSADKLATEPPIVRRAKLLRDIDTAKDKLTELGLAPRLEIILSHGCTTDIPEIVELFSKTAELKSIPTITIHVAQDFNIATALESIKKQLGIEGDLDADPWIALQKLQEDGRFKQIVLNIEPDINPRELSRDLYLFSGKMRGLIQHDAIPTIAFSKNLNAIPSEIGINLRNFQLRSRKQI